MPELGHDVKDFKVFTWRLTNWKTLEKKLTTVKAVLTHTSRWKPQGMGYHSVWVSKEGGGDHSKYSDTYMYVK
jgi:hypothetical protein